MFTGGLKGLRNVVTVYGLSAVNLKVYPLNAELFFFLNNTSHSDNLFKAFILECSAFYLKHLKINIGLFLVRKKPKG